MFKKLWLLWIYFVQIIRYLTTSCLGDNVSQTGLLWSGSAVCYGIFFKVNPLLGLADVDTKVWTREKQAKFLSLSLLKRNESSWIRITQDHRKYTVLLSLGCIETVILGIFFSPYFLAKSSGTRELAGINSCGRNSETGSNPGTVFLSLATGEMRQDWKRFSTTRSE